MSMLEISDLQVAVPGFTLDDICLSIGSRDFFAVIGPTGSGKSLLLEALAGLVPVKKGRISLAGRELNGTPPEYRGIGLVYQDYSLFPHMTVRSNLLFGVRYHRIDSDTASRRLERLAERLGLTHLLHRDPVRLSGGEKQRVALGRVLMINPRAVLLDEPLSALDPVFQDEIKILLQELHREWQIPFVIVSHDFADVLYLADRGAVINKGRLMQQGDMEALFDRPESSFVAEFVGMKNVFDCRLEGRVARVSGLNFNLAAPAGNGRARLGIRPESVRLVARPAEQYANKITGTIKHLASHGFFTMVKVDCGGITLDAIWSRETVAAHRLEPGTRVTLGVHPERLHLF